MIAKVHLRPPVGDGFERAIFWCQGCHDIHCIPIVRLKPTPANAWYFNGNEEKPTFEPSLRVMAGPNMTTSCHLVLTDGIIAYCADTAHKFANQSIGMLAFEWPPKDNE